MIDTEITVLNHKTANLAQTHVALVDDRRIYILDSRTKFHCASFAGLGARIRLFF